MTSVSAQTWIHLNGSGEGRVNDANALDGYSAATWNLWVRQDAFTNNAGLLGKYRPLTGGRSYLIRTSNNSINVVLSADGSSAKSYSSWSSRACGIRRNNEWTMLTVSFNGTPSGGTIKYYRNGVYCDSDSSSLTKLYSSTSPLRIGAGNSVFFRGDMDEVVGYNRTLGTEQVMRLFDESAHGRNKGQSIPVLAYHEIRDPPSNAFSTSSTQFKAQMKYLKDNGFKTVTMRNYLDWRKGSFAMPKKAVIIVFDDGFSSVYDKAKPIMDSFGFVGTVAVVTRYASFTSDTSGYMKWSRLKELVDKGWDTQSHSIDHSHMLSLSESQFRNQLLTSKQEITDRLGKAPTSFVFPFHEADSEYTSICGEYYDLCWTQGSTTPSYSFKSTPGSQYLALRRINIANSTTVVDFVNFLGKDTHKYGEWLLNEGRGTTSADTSGNGNTCYLVGGVQWRSGSAGISALTTTQDISARDLTEDKISLDNQDLEGPYYALHDPIKEQEKGRRPLR